MPSQRDRNYTKNLLKEGRFYYHDELRHRPAPPLTSIQPDGTITQTVKPFFIKMKDNYTLIDLYRYFTSRLKYEDIDPPRTLGGLSYIIEKHGIEATLFAIDALWDDYMGNSKPRPRSVFAIEDYILEALDTISYMRTENSLGGEEYNDKRKPATGCARDK